MCMGTGRILQKTQECNPNSEGNTSFCIRVYMRMGTCRILEKVVLDFPKIMYINPCMCVNRFYFLCAYILYTLTYRGVCVMFIYINYGM